MKKCPRCHGQFEDAVRFCPRDGIALPEIVDPLVGQVLLGQFEILVSCGRGAMGTVYRARQTTMDRIVAVKVLRRELVRDPAVVKRFQREARAVARLSHPNIVTVFLIGETDDGLPYLVMEFVDGESLAEICRAEGALSPGRALGIARQIGSALGEAHAAGVVHRDLKPENISVATRRRTADFVKVLDFGIAKIVAGRSDMSQLTRTGAIFGTPHYISPEQASGGEVDHRADLYSLGVILYRMVTGRLPFDAAGGMQVLLQHIREQPPRPRDLNPKLSPELERLVLRALAKDPAARWQSADDLCAAIDQLPELRASERTANETWSGVGAPAVAEAAAQRAERVAPGATALGLGPATGPTGGVRAVGAPAVVASAPRAAPPVAAAADSGAGSSPLPSTVPAMSTADGSSTTLAPARGRGLRLFGLASLVVVLAGGLAAAVYVARDRVQARPERPAPADAAAIARPAPPADAGVPSGGLALPPLPRPDAEVVNLTLEGYALRVSYARHPLARTEATFWVDVRDHGARPLESAKMTLGLRPPRHRPKDKELRCPGKASALPGRYAAECHLREAGSYHVHVYLQVGGEELQQGFDIVVAEAERDPKGHPRPESSRGDAHAPRAGKPEHDGGPVAAVPSPSPAWPQPPAPTPPVPAPTAPAPPPEQPAVEPPPRPSELPPARPPPRRRSPDDIYYVLDGGA